MLRSLQTHRFLHLSSAGSLSSSVITRSFSTSQHYDILIAGGGIVGSTLAVLLSKNPLCRNLTIGLIEPSPAASIHDTTTATSPDLRVYTLAPSSQRLLEQAGIWQPLLDSQRVASFDQMQVWDAHGDGHIRFAASDVEAAALGHTVEHGLLHAHVYQACVEEASRSTSPLVMVQAGVSSLQPSTNEDRTIRVALSDGTAVTSNCLVAADGGNSPVRRAIGVESWGWTYDQRAVVATVSLKPSEDTPHKKAKNPTNTTAYQRFFHGGPLALLPMTNQHASVVWSCHVAKAESLVSQSPEAFVTALNAALHESLPRPTEPTHVFTSALHWLSSAAALTVPLVTPPTVSHLIGHAPVAIPLALQNGATYVKNHVVLVGDAAHTMHPLAGQGLNLGLSDVASLANVWQQALLSGGDLGSNTVLHQYQAERHLANTSMGLTLDGFKRLFGSQNSTIGLLRNAGMGSLNGLPFLKNTIMKRAMGI